MSLQTQRQAPRQQGNEATRRRLWRHPPQGLGQQRPAGQGRPSHLGSFLLGRPRCCLWRRCSSLLRSYATNLHNQPQLSILFQQILGPSFVVYRVLRAFYVFYRSAWRGQMRRPRLLWSVPGLRPQLPC